MLLKDLLKTEGMLGYRKVIIKSAHFTDEVEYKTIEQLMNGLEELENFDYYNEMEIRKIEFFEDKGYLIITFDCIAHDFYDQEVEIDNSATEQIGSYDEGYSFGGTIKCNNCDCEFAVNGWGIDDSEIEWDFEDLWVI